MPKYKITIEYKGTKYVGWQNQENGQSIQLEIEKALNKLCNQKIQIYGAGRTDAGVHALGQVAHFDLEKNISIDSIRDGVNQFLRPQPIAIVKIDKVNEDFHSRFSAKQRCYKYFIINRRAHLTINKDLAWVIHQKLNIELMQEAAKFFIGKHNFNAFRSINCQSKSSIKTIDYLSINKINEEINILVKAKSFLHSQVRIIVGTLVHVGQRKIDVKDVKKIILSGNRKESGPTAPAEGLYLFEVTY